MRRLRTIAALLGVGVMLALVAPVPVGAQGRSVTVTPNPIPVAEGQTTATVTVSWSGFTPSQLMYVDVCQKPSSAPGFEPGQDCAPLAAQNPNGTPNGARTIQFEVFRGPEQTGDLPWGCFAPGDTAPAGVTKLTTCYVRVTDTSLFNSSNAVDTAFTFVESGGVIPEAPLTVLLPTLGAVVALGGFFYLRRRQALA